MNAFRPGKRLHSFAHQEQRVSCCYKTAVGTPLVLSSARELRRFLARRMSQQSEIKDSAHFQIYELATGLLAPSTRSFLSMYSICNDKVVALMGSLTLKTTTLPGSLSQFCPPLAQHQVQVLAGLGAPPDGVPSFPSCSSWQCHLTCVAVPGLLETHGRGITDLE